MDDQLINELRKVKVHKPDIFTPPSEDDLQGRERDVATRVNQKLEVVKKALQELNAHVISTDNTSITVEAYQVVPQHVYFTTQEEAEAFKDYLRQHSITSRIWGTEALPQGIKTNLELTIRDDGVWIHS